MSAVTAELLLKYGFRYDHSQGHHDFEPYYARVGESWTKVDYSKPAAQWLRPLDRDLGELVSRRPAAHDVHQGVTQ